MGRRNALLAITESVEPEIVTNDEVCFLPAVGLGLYWNKGNATAVLVAMIVGVVVLLIWLGLGYDNFLHEVFPALAASVAAYVCVARASAQRVDLPKLLGLDS